MDWHLISVGVGAFGFCALLYGLGFVPGYILGKRAALRTLLRGGGGGGGGAGISSNVCFREGAGIVQIRSEP